MYTIILFYNYTHIEDPEKFKDEQLELSRRLGLNGRTIIAKEGINSTLEGTDEAIEEFCKIFLSDPRFANTNIKKSRGTGNAFPKLSVKVRDEIVSTHLGDEDVDPIEVTGKYLTADELHEWIESGKKFYIVDMRNDFEHKVGHFEGSILPKLGHFRDLKKILPELEPLKNETVVTVCTGGVRCEKASGFLVKNNFKDVYQLKDGIVTYMEKYPNKDFKGKLYVFDGRITMGFNTDDPEHEVVGKCELCGGKSENYINCTNDECHRHFIVCEGCLGGERSTLCPEGCLE